MSTDTKDILTVLDERAEKRRLRTGLSWAAYMDAIIKSEINTGEQVDAACRMLIGSFKALRHPMCAAKKPDGCMYGDLGCSEAADVLNKLGVKLED